MPAKPAAPTTVPQFLASLPDDRRAELERVRRVVRERLPEGYVEGIAYGMIYYGVPLSIYPDTYNKQPLGNVGLAAQKNAYSLYLMGCYMDSAEDKALRAAYAKAGKKLDMGKSCLRFRNLDGLLLDAIAPIIANTSVEQFIERYEAARGL